MRVRVRVGASVRVRARVRVPADRVATRGEHTPLIAQLHERRLAEEAHL